VLNTPSEHEGRASRGCSGCGAARGGFWAMGVVADEPCQCSGGGGGCGCGDESAPGCGCDSAPPQVWSMLPEVRPTDQQGRELPMRLGSFSRSWGWSERGRAENSIRAATAPGDRGPRYDEEELATSSQSRSAVPLLGIEYLEESCPWFTGALPPLGGPGAASVAEEVEDYLSQFPEWMRAIMRPLLGEALDSNAWPELPAAAPKAYWDKVCEAVQAVVCPGIFDPPRPEFASDPRDECQRALFWFDLHQPKCPPPPILCPRTCTFSDIQPRNVFFRTDQPTLGPAVGVSSDAVRYVSAGWRLLIENMDIVYWLGCLVGGPDAGDCLIRNLSFSQTQTIVFEPNPVFGHHEHAAWNSGGTIHINMVGEKIVPARMRNPDFCDVALLASVLIHELFHSCLGARDILDNPGECDRTYMLQNSLEWALSKRYPCLTVFNTAAGEYAYPECGEWGRARNWMQD
jgi:hypothetical protein